jgi:GTP-binding protein
MKIRRAEFVTSANVPEDLPPSRYPEVAVLGRSNVGKSSLINHLSGRRGLARISRTPGKTRLINFFSVTAERPASGTFYLVDLPGYGYARVPKAMREAWAGQIEGYLKNRETLVAAIILLDIRHEPSPLDRKLRSWIEALGIPTLWAANKADLLTRTERDEAVRLIRKTLDLLEEETVLAVSAKTGEGREEILRWVSDLIRSEA